LAKAIANRAKVQLTWTKIAGADHYTVYRSTLAGGPYLYLGATTNGFYIDPTVVMGITYYYVVRVAALNGDELCQSNEANAKAIRPLWMPIAP
jgi:fibronectin type 3 domain-containing protein